MMDDDHYTLFIFLKPLKVNDLLKVGRELFVNLYYKHVIELEIPIPINYRLLDFHLFDSFKMLQLNLNLKS